MMMVMVMMMMMMMMMMIMINDNDNDNEYGAVPFSDLAMMFTRDQERSWTLEPFGPYDILI